MKKYRNPRVRGGSLSTENLDCHFEPKKRLGLKDTQLSWKTKTGKVPQRH